MSLYDLRRLLREAGARMARVTVDRDATFAVRRQHGAFTDCVVGTFVSSVPLYRAIDHEELERVRSSGTFTGGSYAVKVERAHGASWGSNVTDVIEWANKRRGQRLGQRLYVAKLPDASGVRFFHLDPGIQVDPDGPPEQTTRIDMDRIYTGLGASVSGVTLDDVVLYTLEPDGSMFPVEA